MIFGIFELSSLVFVSALESVQVFARYAISVVLCQIIVQIELATIRAELQHHTKVGAFGLVTTMGDGQGGSCEQIPLHSMTRPAGSTTSQASGDNVNQSGGTVGTGASTSVVAPTN